MFFAVSTLAELRAAELANTQCSVRCVRAREEQAVPLFWIVCFWSSLNLLRDWPESGASSWVRRSVSGLFSNPPAAVWLPVIFRRQPRWNRSATGCVSPCLPVFQWLLFFFPLAGTAGDPVFGGGAYWSCTHGVDGQYGIELSVSAGGAVLGAGWTAVATGYSVRCVRAREGQAIPCFFPLAGSSAEPASIGGNYWSCVGVNGNTAYALGVAVGGYAAMVVHAYSTGVSVRCVRAREEQAIPLFWIVWFWVL